jgi:hypothetical protein
MSELLNLASDLARLLVLDFNMAPRWRGKRNDCTKDFELLLKGLAAYAYLRQWKLPSHKKESSPSLPSSTLTLREAPAQAGKNHQRNWSLPSERV